MFTATMQHTHFPIFTFSFSFQLSLSLSCWHFCPLWVWQGLTLAICVSCLSFTFIHFSFLLLLLLSLSPIITLTSKSSFCSHALSFSFVLYLIHHLLSHSCLPSFLIISFITPSPPPPPPPSHSCNTSLTEGPRPWFLLFLDCDFLWFFFI